MHRTTNAAFLWGRELVFTGSKLLVFTSNYWRHFIFLQLTTCDHELSSSRECFGTVFVLVYYGEHEFTTPKERSISKPVGHSNCVVLTYHLCPGMSVIIVHIAPL